MDTVREMIAISSEMKRKVERTEVTTKDSQKVLLAEIKKLSEAAKANNDNSNQTRDSKLEEILRGIERVEHNQSQSKTVPSAGLRRGLR